MTTHAQGVVGRLGTEIWQLLNKAEMAAWKMGFRDPANVPRRAEVEWFADAVRADEYAAGKNFVKEAADLIASLTRPVEGLETTEEERASVLNGMHDRDMYYARATRDIAALTARVQAADDERADAVARANAQETTNAYLEAQAAIDKSRAEALEAALREAADFLGALRENTEHQQMWLTVVGMVGLLDAALSSGKET